MGLEIKGMDGAVLTFEKLAQDAEARAKKAVKAGAQHLRRALETRLNNQNVSGRSTGELAKSIKADTVKYDSQNGYSAKVHPDGSDSRGEPFGLIGNVLEYGRSGGKGCYPWMQPTVDAESAAVNRIMEETFKKG